MSAPSSMRDLSESPLRAAALAPLVTPLVIAAMATLSDTRSAAGGLDALLRSLLLVWLVAYAYMWVIALPIILVSRRWIRWPWPALVVLGAVLGGLPWLIARLQSPSGVATSRSTDLLEGERVWLLFGACGAAVATAFCILQLVLLRRSRTRS